MSPDDTIVLAKIFVYHIAEESKQRYGGIKSLSQSVLTPSVAASLDCIWKLVLAAPWPPLNSNSPTCILAKVFFKSSPDVWPIVSTWLSAATHYIVSEPKSYEASRLIERLDAVFIVMIKDNIFKTAPTKLRKEVLEYFTRLWIVDMENDTASVVAAYFVGSLDDNLASTFIGYVGGSPSDFASICIQRFTACKLIWYPQYTATEFASFFNREARFIHALMESSQDVRGWFLRAGVVKEIINLLFYTIDKFAMYLRRERRGTDPKAMLTCLTTYLCDLFYCMQKGPDYIMQALDAGLFEVYRRSIILWIHPDSKHHPLLDSGVTSGIYLQLELLLCLVFHKKVFPHIYRAFKEKSQMTRVIPEDAQWKTLWVVLGERVDLAKQIRDKAKTEMVYYNRLPCANKEVRNIVLENLSGSSI
jgi:hypothetical protein